MYIWPWLQLFFISFRLLQREFTAQHPPDPPGQLVTKHEMLTKKKKKGRGQAGGGQEQGHQDGPKAGKPLLGV